MTDYVKAWQCIGCGKIEAPQTCVGVCQDRRVEFVYADEHREALEQVEAANRRADALARLLRQLAWTTPRPGEWESSYRALQARARRLLAQTGDEDPEPEHA